MAKKEMITVTNPKVLKAINEALGGVASDAPIKVTSVTIAAPLDCPKGYKPHPKMTPNGVVWYCKKVRG